MGTGASGSQTRSGGREAPAAAIILAAGKSTRMRSAYPKPLHAVCGVPMTLHVVRACRAAGIQRVIVVVGHEADAVRAALGADLEYVVQAEQRGTGDAVRAAEPLLADWPGAIAVLAGDVPLLGAETIAQLLTHHADAGAAATLLTAHLDDATGYGRIIRAADGSVSRIVEERDATLQERAVREWNPSIYAFRPDRLWPALARVRSANSQGEFYLTDTIAVIGSEGGRIEAVPVADTRDVLGVNTRVELAEVASILRQRILRRHMLAGVTVVDPLTTYVDVDVEIGQDTVLQPMTLLRGGTRIGSDCQIGPSTLIQDSTVGDGTTIRSSQVVESVIEQQVRVGPFANLRPGTRLRSRVKIGDFVEVKNAVMEEGAQASHLSYIGDAEIGAGTNIGAGAITCNYDGTHKHRTVVGARAFIGSNSTLVAPVNIGEGAYVAAGSPITEDVPAESLAIARSRPVMKEGWAARRKGKST